MVKRPVQESGAAPSHLTDSADAGAAAAPTPDAAPLPTRIAFLMTQDYTLITLTSAIAVLRMANRQSGAELYRWQCVTLDGQPVPSSDGLRLVPDRATDGLEAVDIVFVCGGYHPERHASAALMRTLRGFDERGAGLGALCTGAHFLAAAGLLDGYRCAIHWENAESLRAQFPSVQVASSLFAVDRNRYTCSGGVSSIDLMLNLVAAAHGRDLAREISEQFIVDRVRTDHDPQRSPLHNLWHAADHPKLLDAVALMEANVEEPLALAEVAALTGVSGRQLQRLFRRYLRCSPSRHYHHVRLERGRLLLLQTRLPLAEVAAHCGFSSGRRFRLHYRETYGRHPRDERRR